MKITPYLAAASLAFALLLQTPVQADEGSVFDLIQTQADYEEQEICVISRALNLRVCI